jgi:xanthine dehydrogenase accessory factor
VCSRRVVVRGGGDLGSGVALRLWRSGHEVFVLESPQPVAVRRTVSFAEAVYDGASEVEEAHAVLASSVESAIALLTRREIPVLVDPDAVSLPRLRPDALVDAIMAKRNLGTRLDMAPCVVCLGPGFEAGVDCDAVIETNRGPHLGRVLWSGRAEIDTGVPAAVGVATSDRVLRAPTDGVILGLKSIGQVVETGEVVARVDGEPVITTMAGMVRGLARDGLQVRSGMKVGDIDPRVDPELCRLVSDKSMAIAGGVLEAVLMRTRAHD